MHRSIDLHWLIYRRSMSSERRDQSSYRRYSNARVLELIIEFNKSRDRKRVDGERNCRLLIVRNDAGRIEKDDRVVGCPFIRIGTDKRNRDPWAMNRRFFSTVAQTIKLSDAFTYDAYVRRWNEHGRRHAVNRQFNRLVPPFRCFSASFRVDAIHLLTIERNWP